MADVAYWLVAPGSWWAVVAIADELAECNELYVRNCCWPTSLLFDE